MAIQDLHNKGILDLEFGTATKEQQIAWVCKIIEKEAEKPDDEIDYDLIQECREFLDELTADDISYTPEEIEQRLQKQKEDMEFLQKTVQKAQPYISVFTRLKRIKTALKVVLISAMTFIVLFASVSIVGYAQGYSSAWNFISENIQKIVGMNPGDKLEGDGITIIKNTGAVKYKTIEDLLQNENIDILYPSVLPVNVILRKVIYNTEVEDRILIIFQFNSDNLNISVRNNSYNDLNLWIDYTLFETDYMPFYIEKLPDNDYQAVGQYNGYEYIIICPDYNQLISVLENMKGIEK